MRLRAFAFVLLLGLPFISFGQDAPGTPSPTHHVSKSDANKAEQLFQRAMRLQAIGKMSEALEAAESSRELNPEQPAYANGAEFIRQQMVSRHLERGNQMLESDRKIEAMAELRQALVLDPANALAEQMLRESSGLDRPRPSVALEPLGIQSEPQLDPKPGAQAFHFRGSSRDLFQAIGKAFGLTVTFDDSMVIRQVRFEIENVDFWGALQAADKVTHSFAVAVSPREMLIANDVQDVRRRVERLSLRTFYVPEANTPQDMQELLTMVRTLFDVRFVNTNVNASTITVRAPDRTLDAVAQLIDEFSIGRPQVMIEVQALQVDESLSRVMGISLPLQFKLFNINTELRNAISASNQALINQFLATGNINPADATALLALLATQQSGAQSPLLQPFTTFGGGQTRTGVGLPPLSAQFKYSRSLFNSLQKSSIRAEQGHVANFHVGDRYPVPTTSFAPLLNLPSLPSALQSASGLQPLIPSYTYEDLGVTLKMTPQVNAESDVILQLEMTLKSLGATTFNNIPVISNREYKGTISTRDGQTSVIAGSISGSEVDSVAGAPGISRVPGLGLVASVRDKEKSTSQLLLLITPHVVKPAHQPYQSTEKYMEGGN